MVVNKTDKDMELLLSIDSHVHISDDGSWFGSSIDASVAHLIERMASSGTDKAVLLPTFNNCTNKTVYKICRNYPDKFIGFGTVDLKCIDTAIDSVSQARNEYGLLGLKLHPRFQCFAPNEKRLYPLYEKIEEYGLPIVFDGFLQSKTVPMAHLVPMEYDTLAKHFPGLIVILAHMGGHRYWDAYFAAKANQNLFLDSSFIVEVFKELPHIQLDFKYIFKTLDQKILYGSDFPECDPVGQRALMDVLLNDLSLEKKMNIMGQNISKILGLE